MITAATMATVVALVLLSSPTGKNLHAKHKRNSISSLTWLDRCVLVVGTGGEGVICGSHPCAPCPVPDICAGSSNDKCAAWCVSEKFDTGACYGDPKQLLICMCERSCPVPGRGARRSKIM
jgi:hypothetical protein